MSRTAIGLDAVPSSLVAWCWALGVTCIYALIRGAAGLDLHARVMASTLAITGGLYLSSAAFESPRLGGVWTRVLSSAAPVLTLIAFAALGHAQPIAARLGSMSLWLTGMLALLGVLIVSLQSSTRGDMLRASCGAVLASLPVAVVIYGSGYLSPLFSELLVLRGSAHQDTLFHAAVSEMWIQLHTPTTGVEGVVHLTYHWGSHWIYGGLANLTGLSAIDGYQLLPPALGSSFLLLGLLQVGNALADWLGDERQVQPSFRLTLMALFVAASVGVVPGSIAFASGVPERRIVSESFVLALAIVLLLSRGIFELVRQRNVWWWRAGQSVALVAIGIVAIVKISVGAVLAATWAWIVLRSAPWSRAMRVLAVCTVGLAAASAVKLVVAGSTASNARPSILFPFVTLFQAIGTGKLFLTLCWSLVAFAMARRLIEHSEPSLAARVKHLLHLLVVLAVACTVPMLVVNSEDTGYFLDIQRWTSIPFLAIATSLLMASVRPSVRASGWRSLFSRLGLTASATTLTVVVALVLTLGVRAKRIAADITELSAAAALRRTSADPLADVRERRHELLTRLEAIRRDVVPGTGLVLDSSAWNVFSGSATFGCFAPPFVFVAYAGTPVINALPSAACRRTGFGYDDYPNTDSRLRRDEMNDEEACVRARQVGLDAVLRIPVGESISTPPRVIPCHTDQVSPHV